MRISEHLCVYRTVLCKVIDPQIFSHFPKYRSGFATYSSLCSLSGFCFMPNACTVWAYFLPFEYGVSFQSLFHLSSTNETLVRLNRPAKRHFKNYSRTWTFPAKESCHTIFGSVLQRRDQMRISIARVLKRCCCQGGVSCHCRTDDVWSLSVSKSQFLSNCN